MSYKRAKLVIESNIDMGIRVIMVELTLSLMSCQIILVICVALVVSKLHARDIPVTEQYRRGEGESGDELHQLYDRRACQKTCISSCMTSSMSIVCNL